MTATCIGKHTDDPPLTTHGMLCARCHGRLARALADIVALYPTLAVVVMLSGNPSGGSRGKPGSRPPCNVDVIDLTDPRGETHAQIAGWTRIVIEERRLAAQPADIEQAARLLTIHLDWIAEQPWCDEALLEISNVAYRIRRACNDLPDPPIGTCPDVDPRGETDRCGGPLRWIDGYVQCSRCDGRWDSSSLIYLGRVSPINMWGSVPQIAEMVDASERTVRRWVSTGKVRKNTFGQVRHADVWHILQARSEPPAASVYSPDPMHLPADVPRRSQGVRPGP